MGMIELRDYQTLAVDAVRSAYISGSKSPLLVAPTGSGKTVIFSYITHSATQKGLKTMILVHRAELLMQTHKALNKMGVKHGLIAANKTPDPTLPVQIASVQTLIRRLDKFPHPDLIIIDEAHHASAGSWQTILNYYPNAKKLGVTATPARLDGKGLRASFDAMIKGPEVADLIDKGWLCKPIYYAPSNVDMSKARTTAGDWNRADAEAIINKPKITGDAVSHYKKLCSNAPAVVFCASIKHAEDVAAAFNAEGYSAAVLDGKLDPVTRATRVNALANGQLKVITSCDIISEGFDLPLVTVAILLRPTQSLSLHLQQIGRVLRPADNKSNAIILDHVGNCLRHGLAEDARDWSLDGIKKRKKKDEDKIEKHKQCPECYAVHTPSPSCPQCGHIYIIKARELEQVDGELKMLDIQTMQAMRAKKQTQGLAKTHEELVAIGKQRGYRNPWAWASFIIKGRSKKR